MKRLLLAVTVTTAVMLSSGQSLAHHSFAATYFEDKTEKIEGALVQFLLPDHCYRKPRPESGGLPPTDGDHYAPKRRLEMGRDFRLRIPGIIDQF